MKAINFYVVAAIGVAIAEITDGVLFILNDGVINDYNLLVALIELTWLFVSAFNIYIFYRNKISMLSPISFVGYILTGWFIASISGPSQVNDSSKVSLGFAIAGILFGIYYLIINERTRAIIADNQNSSEE